MRTYFIITFLLSLAFGLVGQELKIRQGNRKKTFPSGSLYHMVLKDGSSKSDSCCNYIEIDGRIISITNDSIKLKLTTYGHHIRDNSNNPKINYMLSSKDGGLDLAIAQQDINYFKHYNSEKQKKRKRSLGPVGGILILMSFGTMTSYFLIDNKSDRERVWKIAGGEFALGLTLAILSSPKRYKFKEKDGDNWAIIP